MQNNKKLVLFDFCESLIKFQTADRFIDFCRKKENSFLMDFLDLMNSLFSKLYVYRILFKLFKIKGLSKKLKLYQLKGISREKLDKYGKDYYQNILKLNIIEPILKKLLKHLENKDDVWIVSGGYDVYIKYFVEEFGLNGYISSKVQFNDKNISTGKMDGMDCMNENKILLLNQTIPKLLLNNRSIAYSDSISDLPLLKWADEGIVVSKNSPQPWAKENNLKEIIWS